MLIYGKKLKNHYLAKQKRILVAPLNWGLGHVTRCMPIIEALQKQGCTVILASDGRSYQLLQKEYPNLRLLSMPSYGITYGTGNMIKNIAFQMPKILWAMEREWWWLRKIIQEENIDGVISDNRYGLYSSKIPCVFLTHQLHIKIPSKIISFPANWNSRRLINRNTACWVPDFAGGENLSGELSHGGKLPKNVRYVGPLSRMKRVESPLERDIIVVLSGPEPQRTFLETELIGQLAKLAFKALIVRGVPDEEERYSLGDNLSVVSYMTAKELNQAMVESKIVIARSGYSTVMDLVKLGKQAILIPTPGQTEQEYLADLFHQKKYFLKMNQSEINLPISLKKMTDFKGFPLNYRPELLEEAVADFCSLVTSRS